MHRKRAAVKSCRYEAGTAVIIIVVHVQVSEQKIRLFIVVWVYHLVQDDWVANHAERLDLFLAVGHVAAVKPFIEGRVVPHPIGFFHGNTKLPHGEYAWQCVGGDQLTRAFALP